MPKHIVTAQNTPVPFIESRIWFIREHKVLLDSDLAELYEVETRALNQAVRRKKAKL